MSNFEISEGRLRVPVPKGRAERAVLRVPVPEGRAESAPTGCGGKTPSSGLPYAACGLRCSALHKPATQEDPCLAPHAPTASPPLGWQHTKSFPQRAFASGFPASGRGITVTLISRAKASEFSPSHSRLPPLLLPFALYSALWKCYSLSAPCSAFTAHQDLHALPGTTFLCLWILNSPHLALASPLSTLLS